MGSTEVVAQAADWGGCPSPSTDLSPSTPCTGNREEEKVQRGMECWVRALEMGRRRGWHITQGSIWHVPSGIGRAV